MEVGIVLKVAGIGFLVAVACQVLGRTGRDEQAMLVNKIVINDMVDKLSFRDKTIIKLRFFKEKTQMQVAKMLGMSQVQVSRIEKRILEQMKEKMVG